MTKRILLIDDEIDFTELTSTLLRFHDLEVDTYNEPTSVLEAIDNHNYSLIVSDLMMPNMNGFELIEKLRKEEKYQNTPVIVLTAKILTDEERKTLLKLKVHFLAKPFEPQALVDQIKQLL